MSGWPSGWPAGRTVRIGATQGRLAERTAIGSPPLLVAAYSRDVQPWSRALGSRARNRVRRIHAGSSAARPAQPSLGVGLDEQLQLADVRRPPARTSTEVATVGGLVDAAVASGRGRGRWGVVRIARPRVGSEDVGNTRWLDDSDSILNQTLGVAAVAFGDIDGDGRPDVIVAHNAASWRVNEIVVLFTDTTPSDATLQLRPGPVLVVPGINVVDFITADPSVASAHDSPKPAVLVVANRQF